MSSFWCLLAFHKKLKVEDQLSEKYLPKSIFHHFIFFVKNYIFKYLSRLCIHQNRGRLVLLAHPYLRILSR